MKLYIAGHRGMVGRALVRQLKVAPNVTLILRSSAELDLRDQAATAAFFREERPDGVILAAARVGGIGANQASPAEFIQENIAIAANVIHQAHLAGVEKLVQIASSAIYPPQAPQPLREEALLSGALDPTHEPYALAKIAAIKMCEAYHRQYGSDFRSVVPTNLYGPGDNFGAETSHVMPGLIRRFHEAAANGAEEVVVWGSGRPRREFLHVDDMARGVLHVFGLDRATYESETTPHRSHLNLGTGEDISIRTLCDMIAGITRFNGRIVFDSSKPDGVARKLMNVDRLARLGWRPQIGLETGIEETYRWYRSQQRAALRLE